MRIKSVQNISEYDVFINLSDGNMVRLAPNQMFESSNIGDISGTKRFLRVQYDLGEVNPAVVGRIQLRD